MPTEQPDEQVRGGGLAKRIYAQLHPQLKWETESSNYIDMLCDIARFILAREKKLREALEILSKRCSCNLEFSHSIQCTSVIAAIALSAIDKEDKDG